MIDQPQFDLKESMTANEFHTTSLHFPESAVVASGRSGGVSALAGRKRGRGGRAAALSSLCLMFVVMVAAMVNVAAAEAATGDGFGFAPVTDVDSGTTAPAFPGERAWWAGVCDLQGGTAGVGSLPATPFAHCIDHPNSGFNSSPVAPLAPGVEAGGERSRRMEQLGLGHSGLGAELAIDGRHAGRRASGRFGVLLVLLLAW